MILAMVLFLAYPKNTPAPARLGESLVIAEHCSARKEFAESVWQVF